MDLLSRSTILYINQVRQDNFEVLVGKGFSEALSWRNYFKTIIFVCYSSTKNLLYKKLYNNFYLIGIPFEISPSTFKSIISLGKNFLNLFLFLFRLKKLVKIDIIRMENLLISGPSVYLISRLKNKIPYVIWLGGHERDSLFIKYGKNFITLLLSKVIILLEKIILKNANFVFPVTDELMDLADKRNVKNKILSPNFVDLAKFKDTRSKNSIISKKKIKILYVGRFEEEKGIRVLLNAIRILSNESEIIELLMVGHGSLRDWVENFIKENKIKNVSILGIFGHEEMPRVYNSADIFILPSYTEGSPASLIEAMSCGTPSIATAVGESKKIIKNGENGILITPGDPNKLSEAIRHLLYNRDLLEKFSENGRISIQKYTKNYTKIHKYVYEKILNQLKN